MFITDLDGTLFTDDKKINHRDFQSLERLGEMGVKRVFATGRSLYSFQQAVQKMGFTPYCEDLPVDYLIFSTGAGIIQFQKNKMEIMDERKGESTDESKMEIIDENKIESADSKILRKHSLESDDVRYISDYFDSLKLDYMIHRPIPDTPYCIYRQQSKWINFDFSSRIKLYSDFCTQINYTGSVRDFGQATELLTIVPAEQGHDIADMIHEALPQFSVIRATSPLDGESIWIEVFNKTVSKSQAVSWLANQLDIRQQDVAAIGNDYNDIDMLNWAGHGFVMKNTPKKLKERLRDKQKFTEVASNNDCGVSEAISFLG
ncbi:MAG: HAD hydrolase family protein [Desulfamplus sp.]|nr:HAD hydrolase family protein [Desulfamplus sp.]